MIRTTKIWITVFLISLGSFAQEFSPQVKAFIVVDTNSIAITNVTLIDGTGGEVKEGQTIILNNGIVQDVGNAVSVVLPRNSLIINGTGKTVIPGLVMLHEHLFYSKPFENWFSVDQMTFTFPRLYLAGGVTTMRTGGSIQPQTDLNVKKWIDEGKMTGPKMDVTGPFIEREGYDIPELGFIEGTAEVAEMVNYWADKGVTSFKVYNHITKDDLRICVAEAHKRGLKVTGHLCSLTYAEASNLGIDNLEHGFMASSDFVADKMEDLCDPFKGRKSLIELESDDPKMEVLMDLLIKNNTTITTTPVVFEPYTGYEVVPGGGFSALIPQLQEDLQNKYNRSINNDSTAIALYKKDLEWTKRFYDKGGKLVAGTDPTGAGRTVAGYANQRTLEILVESGFSIPEAIKIATLNGAVFLKRQKEIGSIEKGKKADLILIDGDLREDIKNIRKMEVIFKDGVGFDSKKLFESVQGKVGLY
ncbi:amidohydrolase family protein [Gillisia sp. CAL575]|uniref:amidohydrolase family protein n=1 Tax=Gillisia sp. CAL575 TaxID=985255 RepID=UPI0003AADDDE|nr:amidohydrolase family protein [Gillisia sp. CAL575]